MPNLLERKMLKDRIVQGFSKAVKLIQESQYSASVQGPQEAVFTNTDWQFHRLVDGLDHALLHGLKHITSGYWALVQDFTHQATIRDIKHLQNVTTHLGRGRAWLYYALMDRLLESYMRCFLDNPKLVKKFYVPEALVQDKERMQIILTLSAGLEFVSFQLEVDCAYLDLSSHEKPRRRSNSQYEDDPDDKISLCSMASSQTSNATPEQGVDIADITEVSDAIDSASTSYRVSPVSSRNSSTVLTGQVSNVLEERSNKERFSKISTRQSLDLDSTDIDLVVTRMKVKVKSSKKKRSPKSQQQQQRDRASSDSSSVNTLNVDVDDLESPVTPDNALTPESGYRSVTDSGESPKQKTFDRSSISSSDRVPSGSDCDTRSEGNSNGHGRDFSQQACDNGSVLEDSVKSDVTVIAANESVIEDDIYSNGQPPSHKQTKESQDSLENRVVQKSVAENSTAKNSKVSDIPQQTFSVSLSNDLTWNSPSNKKENLSSRDSGRIDISESEGSVGKQKSDDEVSIYDGVTSNNQVENDKTVVDVCFEQKSPGSSSENVENYAHDLEDYHVKLDNNLKLVLMLEVLHSEDEQLLKLYRSSLGHTEGELTPVLLLISTHALYVLRPGDSGQRFSTTASVKYTELDYLSLSVGSHYIQVVCTNRRKQLWITTGCEALTREIVSSVDDAVKKSEMSLGRLSVLTDATTQKIAVKKWAATECHCQASDVTIVNYCLPHWEDYQSGVTMTTAGTTKDGMLMTKSQPSMFGFVGGAWMPAYFVLKDGALYQYTDRHDTGPPTMVIQLNHDECGGCRRCRDSDREHAFEIILNEGSTVELCTESAAETQGWLQALCQAVTEGMGVRLPNTGLLPCCSVLTETRLIMCHEDVQTNFFRTLGAANIDNITTVLTDSGAPRYIVLVFDGPSDSDPDKWILYFSAAAEAHKFLSSLTDTWSKVFQVPLPTQQITDIGLQKRCRDSLAKIRRQMQSVM